MRYLLLVLVLAAAASIATYARYESLDPCVWMEQDMAERSGLPRIVIQAQIRANFLVTGITEPDAYDCLMAWWRLRSEETARGS